MPRPRPSRPAALAGAAILVAALGSVAAFAQVPSHTQVPPITQVPLLGPLRTAIDETADEQKPGATRRPVSSREPSRIGRRQIFGNPPASGAGATGFDSSNTRRRVRPGPTAGQSAPQNILGPAATPVPPGSSWTSRPGMPRLPAQTGAAPAPAGSSPSGTTTGPTEVPASGAPPPLSAPPPPRSARTTRNPKAPAATYSTNPAALPGTAIQPTTTATAPPVGAVTAPGTAPVPAAAAPAVGATPAAVPYPGLAAPLVSVRQRPVTAEDDPYDALGIRVGTFIVRPAVEVTSGYDTNPSRVPDARGSWFYQVAPELLARSDWERHQLTAEIRSSYSEYPSVPLANRPNIDAKVDGRIDVTRLSHIDLQGRYLLSTDYPGSPNIPAGLAKLPVFQTVGGTAGFTQGFNRLEISAKGMVDRTEYQDSLLTDGSTSSNKDRDYNRYGAALRGSYEVTPGIRPFAELYADTRIHDLKVDRNGDMRDSEALIPRIGSTIEISRKLTGEVSIGYVTRTFKDPTLPDIRGLIVDGSLIWTATGLTTVRLTAKSTEDESVLANVSGVLRRDAGLQVDHAFRRWLIGTAKLGFGLDEYVGSPRVDHRYSASVGLAYKLTRSVQIKGELRQEWLRSNITGNDYTATIALIGLRLQR